jgi:hypothetical protein
MSSHRDSLKILSIMRYSPLVNKIHKYTQIYCMAVEWAVFPKTFLPLINVWQQIQFPCKSLNVSMPFINSAFLHEEQCVESIFLHLQHS